MKSILDPTFRYVPSASTDLRKTFSRIRREMRQADDNARTQSAESTSRVLRFTGPRDASTRQ